MSGYNKKVPKYAALLRGISPTNPNMQNKKLRGVFEAIGFTGVVSVISSGNIIFESPRTDVEALEAAIEKALYAQLGITSTTIIRSQKQLQHFAEAKPFGAHEHGRKSYLTVTFLKHESRISLPVPYRPTDQPYEVVSVTDRAVCSIVDTTSTKTPNLMAWLEKQFGKDITTRTWQTVGRILKAMS